jgi:hypothetical protein
MRRYWPWALAAALSAPAAAQENPASRAVPVKLQGRPGDWTLLRGGEPYFIRGGAGGASLDQLAAHGGNSVRTWGAGQLPEALEQAESRGLTMIVGLWLGHKGDGFDYSDPAQVEAQQNAAVATVLKYKNEPGVLAWGLGNEMEVDNDTPELWKAVNALARMIKEVDPAHPSVTVVAEVSASKLENIRRYAPAVDILGVNSYGGAATLAQRLADAGWTKPYIVTEFGPRGPWESPKTSWGAPLEPTSTQKADTYRRSYAAAVAGAAGRCLGSYAFDWGYKYEGTATWFGMLMPESLETLGAVDAVSESWTGARPGNVAPEIQSLDFKSSGGTVAPGAELTACVKASDPDGDSIAATWRLRKDVRDAPDLLAGADAPAALCVSFRAPPEPGGYRLYVELRDGRGHGATANAPFLVDRISP